MLRYPYSVVVFGLAIVGLSVAIAWLPSVWDALRQAWRRWRVRRECRSIAENRKIANWSDRRLAAPHLRYHGDPKRQFSGQVDLHTVQRRQFVRELQDGRQLDDLRIDDR